jgi:hypothetical protein
MVKAVNETGFLKVGVSHRKTSPPDTPSVCSRREGKGELPFRPVHAGRMVIAADEGVKRKAWPAQARSVFLMRSNVLTRESHAVVVAESHDNAETKSRRLTAASIRV